MKKSAQANWGFDPKTIDFSIRPQDDFYRYANGKWIEKNPIPQDESRWGSFTILRYNTEHQLKDLVESLLTKRNSKGTAEQLVADFYTSASDMKARNALGTKPMQAWRREINAIGTRERLLGTIALLHRQGISVPWEFYLDQDAKNSSRYLFHLTQDGIGMPEREYYLSDAPEQKRVREAYKKHIGRMLTLSGIPKKETSTRVAVVLMIETRLARASMSKEDSRDSEKTYNKRTVAQLQREVPTLDWRTYFGVLGAANCKEVVIAHPGFFKEIGIMLRDISVEDWKIYLEWHLINECAPLLSDSFIKASFEFYGKVLTGSKKMRAPWRRALGATNGGLGEAVGALYIKKHFTAGAKRRMELLVQDLFTAYEKRIKTLDWMSPQTKTKAIQKLKAMRYKIGYPKKFDTYGDVEIKATDYFGNVLRTHEHYHKKSMRRLGKPVDRDIWFMTPQTINAYCHFNLNEIVFPAAILQTPFFNAEADDAINFGGIGAVIGHEITHGFDDQGSKFNGKGNMLPWWTNQDKNRFEKKAEVLVKQFNNYEVLEGINANGKLTLGENIADLGGASIAFDAYMTKLSKTGRKNIDGFTPEQRFFLGFAQAEREVSRPEFMKMQALTDPHSVAPLRVNGPVSNLEAFYEAFSLKKGDKLYRDPKNRAKIW